MGRKYKNQRKKDFENKLKQDPNLQKKVKVSEEYKHTYEMKRNFYFELFYKIMLKDDLKDESDFKKFTDILYEKLPMTFRVNPCVPNYQAFVQKLRDPHMIQKLCSTENEQKITENMSKRKKEFTEEDLELMKDLQFEEIKWYPNGLVWQLLIDKNKFRKSSLFDSLHKIIQKSADTGLLTRQELVSMIPPLLLDIQHDDIVLDMCAAPGYYNISDKQIFLDLKLHKCQKLCIKKNLMEKLIQQQGNHQHNINFSSTKGVIANDCDLSRASMLIHQIQRMNSAGMMVINHHGQFIPTLYKNKEINQLQQSQQNSNNKYQYDKILADVPCTGDGAIRKLPQKWLNWHTNDGFGLFHLQVQLLQRAIMMAKVGGLILYSTCSINPIEDEAVVTEVFRRFNEDSIELIDISNSLKGLKARRGLSKWPVACLKHEIKQKFKDNNEPFQDASEVFNIYENYDEFKSNFPSQFKTSISKSMFPDDEETMINKYKIQNTLRLMPQDQNTGGFYVALIRKKNVTYTVQKSDDTNNIIKDDMKVKKKKTIISEQSQINEPIQIEYQEKNLNSVQSNDGLPVKELNQVQQTNDQKNVVQKKFEQISNIDWDKIQKFYCLNNDFPRENLIHHLEMDKKVIFVSNTIKQVLKFDSSNLFNKINMGLKAFERQRAAFIDDACPFRICQDAVLCFLPFLGARKIKVDIETFKQLFQGQSFAHNSFKSELQMQLQQTSPGSLVLFVDEFVKELGYTVRDAIVVNNFKDNFTLMISKDHIESFKIRYF